MNPKRTAQYRANKLGLVDVYDGVYIMPPEVKAAKAVRPDVSIHAYHPGQEAFSSHHLAAAYASAPNTTAYATVKGARAFADSPGTTAIACAEGSYAYANMKGSTALSTINGAVARARGQHAVARHEPMQDVFPNHTATLVLGL
jgi:hypothetical protein